ncbi:MAG: hypothetical protein M1828_004940 [Chrysothrix sp. TS-e1954]|nr:MAG: hypothetical protein M1828_004940 [Chrysothrix sp. TS-e1954]
MPFTSRNTPEANLPRSDSKNPARTCRGITSLGRPCRRSLANAPGDRIISDAAVNGVIAVHSNDVAAFYCWQHKNQAESYKLARKDTQLYPLVERTSIDTLVSRIGGLNIDTPQPPRPDPSQQSVKRRKPSNKPSKASTKRSRPSLLALLCCGGQADDDYLEVVKHKRRVNEPSQLEKTHGTKTRPQRDDAHVHTQGINQLSPLAPPDGGRGSRETAQRSSSNLLSWIPPSLPPPIMSQLLTELAKPLPPASEDGYIYIFWLTSSNQKPPSTGVTSSLLAPPSPQSHRSDRRRSDVLQQYSIPTSPGTQRASKVLLKIGRASNVHRRMNEWTRQCGYDLSLVRFYPYVASAALAASSSPTPTVGRSWQASKDGPSDGPERSHSGIRKVQHVQRVERLVHIELSSQRLKQGPCPACGREHREWFEVEASRAGLKAVDEVIQRWVSWAEGLAGGRTSA